MRWSVTKCLPRDLHRFSRQTAVLLLVGLLCIVPVCSRADDAQQEDIAYRQKRADWMRSERSPLALAGLFWLKEGESTFGTAAVNDIILPPGSAPAKAGRFKVHGNRVTVTLEHGVAMRLAGQPISSGQLKSDAGGVPPDLLELNDLRMKVIQRGEQLALRLIHLKNPPLLRFKRLDFYDIDPAYRVEGTFTPHRPAKKIRVAMITGQVEELECPGFVEFALQGRNHKLEPVYETAGDPRLYFMFKDATNGPETYGGGRYLYSALPRKGKVVLNFNQAHNPYCAYNSYSTCGIPPVQNWLKVAIRAGEKKYPDSQQRPD
jgi:uncharacterized protein (DUF1684 family)